MGVEFKSTSGPALHRKGDLAAILTSLKPRSLFFIDEIHRLSPVVEEYLYSAMEDYKLDIMIDSGPNARTVQISLPKYTLERLLGLDIPSESAGSVGGLIMEKLQRLPGQGESIDFDGFTIRILSTRGPRILEVEVIPAPRHAADEWSGA